MCVLKGWKQAMENVTDLDIPIIHGIQMRRNLDEQILFFLKSNRYKNKSLDTRF